MVELELDQIFPRLLVQLRNLEAKQVIKEVEIGKYRREMLAIIIPILPINWRAVEKHLPHFGRIKTGDHLDECGFAAAVTTCNKDHLAGEQSEIERADRKTAVFTLAMIRVCNIEKLYLAPLEHVIRKRRRIVFRRLRLKQVLQAFKFIDGDFGLADHGEGIEHELQGGHHV